MKTLLTHKSILGKNDCLDCANKTIQRNVTDNEHENPDAAPGFLKKVYKDVCLHSMTTLERVLDRSQALTKMASNCVSTLCVVGNLQANTGTFNRNPDQN